MATWNHRIVQKEIRVKGKVEETYYEVHEAHYNSNGELCAITEGAVPPVGETVEELEEELQRMIAACKKPILIDGQIEFATWDSDEDKDREF